MCIFNTDMRMNILGHSRFIPASPASDPISLSFAGCANLSDAEDEGRSSSAASAAFLEEVSNISCFGYAFWGHSLTLGLLTRVIFLLAHAQGARSTPARIDWKAYQAQGLREGSRGEGSRGDVHSRPGRPDNSLDASLQAQLVTTCSCTVRAFRKLQHAVTGNDAHSYSTCCSLTQGVSAMQGNFP